MAQVGASSVASGCGYYVIMFLFLAAMGLGAGFIVTSMSESFLEWNMNSCYVEGQLLNADSANNTGKIVGYDLNVTANIGWRDFKVTYIDSGAAQCFVTIAEGETYNIADFDNNSGSRAGYGMVGAWGLGVIIALVTMIYMIRSKYALSHGCFRLKTLSNLTILLTIGIVAATTVFWWCIAGKFGNRDGALTAELQSTVAAAADKCDEGSNNVVPCRSAEYETEVGFALALGIIAMFAYALATILLYLIAPRVDALLDGTEDPEPEPVKHAVGGDYVANKGIADDKARAKDRRSAKTGVRAGGNARAPSSTVTGDSEAGLGPDPMTYALQGGTEEDGSAMSHSGDEEEVVYQNHQVHHNVINHSIPNRTQAIDNSRASEQPPRYPGSQGPAMTRSQLSRGYSRGTSGHSFTGGQSFESDPDFSDNASSAYYAHGEGGNRSFMSGGSQADSFDDYGDSHSQAYSQA